MVVATTLQGLTARKGPQIWLEMDGVQRWIREDLARAGTEFVRVPDVWTLVRRHRDSVRGAILYRLGTPSLNVATSLAGVLDGVAVEESLAATAKAAGLPVLADARSMTDAEAFERYGRRFRRGVVVEQMLDRPAHLRDYAVKHRAFTFDAADRTFRQRVVRELAPGGLAFGWSRDEYHWIEDLARAGASGVPADWCRNLSVLEGLPIRTRPPARRFPPVKPQGRAVAFVLSDGDNIQWLTNAFATDKTFFGSPRRGTFPMTWEVSPLLAKFAPRALEAIYRRATPNDDFVTGPGLPGYTFPSLLPEAEVHAKRSAPFLRASGLSIASFLNANDQDMGTLAPWMGLSEVRAGIYKEYAPYHRPNGRVRWFGDKPLVGYRFILWENLMGIEDLAARIAAMPPTGDGRFALINVHAWSFGSIGGPLEAVHRVLQRLSPDTEVVTATALIEAMKRDRQGR